MKILISDPLSKEGINLLKKHFTVEVSTGLTEDELIQKIKDFDALVIRSGTTITKKVIDAADNLKIIGRAGVGVDNIDINAATEKGILVVNTPEGNMLSTAEHTLAMILSLSRNIPQAVASLKSKKWERKKFTGIEVNNKILGVIGLGRIGTEIAKRALGLNMEILAYDPFISEEHAKNLGVTLATVEEIAIKSDFITVHTPLTKETKGILDKEKFALMKDGVRVINCARGGIIDEEALIEALESGKVAGAALDVFVEEPPFDNKLLEFDNVIATPHLGASTKEAQVNVAVSVAEDIISVLNGGVARNSINIPAVKPEAMAKILPYIKLAETIGGMIGELSSKNYTTIELNYSGEIVQNDLRPITIAAIKGLLEPVLGSSVNYVNATLLAKSRKIKIIESTHDETEEYTSTINVKLIQQDGMQKSVTGAIIEGTERIIQIDENRVDILPFGYMIISNHINKPNVIGPCCVVLGENNINISGMQVGRAKIGKSTIMILNVDTEVSESILDKMREVDGIIDAKCLYFG